MKIRVEQKHIDLAKRYPDGPCPIARAMLDQTGLEYWVQATYVTREDAGIIPLPISARGFVASFDTHGTVKPFSFHLPV